VIAVLVVEHPRPHEALSRREQKVFRPTRGGGFTPMDPCARPLARSHPGA